MLCYITKCTLVLFLCRLPILQISGYDCRTSLPKSRNRYFFNNLLQEREYLIVFLFLVSRKNDIVIFCSSIETTVLDSTQLKDSPPKQIHLEILIIIECYSIIINNIKSKFKNAFTIKLEVFLDVKRKNKKLFYDGDKGIESLPQTPIF